MFGSVFLRILLKLAYHYFAAAVEFGFYPILAGANWDSANGRIRLSQAHSRVLLIMLWTFSLLAAGGSYWIYLLHLDLSGEATVAIFCFDCKENLVPPLAFFFMAQRAVKSVTMWSQLCWYVY